MKKRFTNYGFWISLSSAVVVLFEAIGRAVGFIPDGAVINNIIMAIAGVLVVLGVVSMPSEDKKEQTTETEIENKTLEENNAESSENVEENSKKNND